MKGRGGREGKAEKGKGIKMNKRPVKQKQKKDTEKGMKVKLRK
jgi:hypothetical protein